MFYLNGKSCAFVTTIFLSLFSSLFFVACGGADKEVEQTTVVNLLTEQEGSFWDDGSFSTFVDYQGNRYLIGATKSNIDNPEDTTQYAKDAFLVKYMNDGTKWIKHWGAYGTTSTYDDEAYGVTVSRDGTIYVTGYTANIIASGQTHIGGKDVFLTAYSSTGTQLWSKQWGSTADDYGRSLVVDDENGYIYVVGYTAGVMQGENKGQFDIYISRIDVSGSHSVTTWQDPSSEFNTPYDDYAVKVAMSAGHLYITGSSEGAFGEGSTARIQTTDSILMKWNIASGAAAWKKQWGPATKNDVGNSVIVDDTYAYVVGRKVPDGYYYTLGYLVRLAISDGTMVAGSPSSDFEWGPTAGYSGGNGYTDAVDITRGIDGSFYVTGGTNSYFANEYFAGGTYDFYIRKYTNAFAYSWTKMRGTNQVDWGYGISIDSADKVYVAGATYAGLDGEEAEGNADAFLYNYFDTDKKWFWTKQRGTSSEDKGTVVATDSSGNMYVAGSTSAGLDGNTLIGNKDAFLSKYYPDGSWVWTKQFGTTAEDIVTAITVRGSNVYVAGTTMGAMPGNDHIGGTDIFITAYTTGGTLSWVEQIGSTANDKPWAITTDDYGYILIAGETYGALPGQTQIGGRDCFLAKRTSTGGARWIKQTGTSASEAFTNIVFSPIDSYIYVSGFTTGVMGSASAGNADAILVKYFNSTTTTPPTATWTTQWGGASNDYGSMVAVDNEGVLYVIGNTEGVIASGLTSSGGTDAFYSMILSSGSIVWNKQIGSSGTDQPSGRAVDSDNYFYVTGKTTGAMTGTNKGGVDLFMFRFDKFGYVTSMIQRGSSGNDEPEDIAVDASGNIYIVGATAGSLDGNTNIGSYDIFLSRFITDFSSAWPKQWGGSSNDYIYDATTDAKGNIYVAGKTASDGNKAFIKKFNFDGTNAWTKQWGSNSNEYAYRVAIDDWGGIYTVGALYNAIGASSIKDAYIRKIDESSSDPIWQVLLGDNNEQEAISLAIDSVGNLYVLGHTLGAMEGQSLVGGRDLFLTKITPAGTKIWTTIWGTTAHDYAGEVKISNDGYLYVVGRTYNGVDNNYADVYISKLNKDTGALIGTPVQWTDITGRTYNEYGRSLVFDTNNNLYIVGDTNGAFSGYTNAGNYDIFLAKCNSNLTPAWVKQWGTSGEDRGYAAKTDKDGNIYITGWVTGSFRGNSTSGSSDPILIKVFSSDGSIAWATQKGSSGYEYGQNLTIDAAGNIFYVGYTNGSLPNNTNAGGYDPYIYKFAENNGTISAKTVLCADSYTKPLNSSDTTANTTTLFSDANGWAQPSACTEWTCNTNYTQSGNSCVADTQTYNCNAKPATGTAWNTVYSYQQTWNGAIFSPIADPTTEYNETASETECRYKCATNYTWNGSACINSRTQSCGGIISNAVYYNGTTSYTITQSYTDANGWQPPTTAYYGDGTPDSNTCEYKCATNYAWNGSACINSRTQSCGGIISNAVYYNGTTSYTITQSYTDANGWQPPTTAYYGDGTPDSNTCEYKCDSVNGYVYDGTLPVNDRCRKCGDGIRAGTEVCDGADLNGKTCATQVSGATGGTLSCNGTCTDFVTTECTKTYTCNAKPETGTVWNTVWSYQQTWDGSAWVPADDATTEYNATGSETSCRYACDTNYIYEEGACIHSKQVNCDQTQNPNNSYNIVAEVTVTYTSGIGWSDPDACAWKCYQDETNGYFVREGNACIHDKTIDCPGTTNDLEYVYSEPDITLTLVSCSGSTCEWLGDDGEDYTTTISTETTEVLSWPEKSECPCITGTYRSQANEPLTECIPYGAIDFKDKDLHLCLRRFMGWDYELDGSTKYYLAPYEVDEESLVDCTYDENQTMYNTIIVPKDSTLTTYWPDQTIGKIQSLRGIEYMKNLKELYLHDNAVHDLKPLTKLSETGFHEKYFEMDSCFYQGTDYRWSAIIFPSTYDCDEDIACIKTKSVCDSQQAMWGVYFSYSQVISGTETKNNIVCFGNEGHGDPVQKKIGLSEGADSAFVFEKRLFSSENECGSEFDPERLLVGFLKNSDEWNVEPPALEALDLSKNGIATTSGTTPTLVLEGLNRLSRLKYLVLADNTIDSLVLRRSEAEENPESALNGLLSLEGLDLSKNQLTSTALIPLKDSANLKYLYLAENDITTANPLIGKLEEECACRQQEGFLWECDSEYEGCLCEVSTCCNVEDPQTGLCIENKRSDYLLKHLTNLERFDLRDNPLASGTDYGSALWGIHHLAILRSLDIGSPEGSSVPLNIAEISPLTLLEYLDLSGRRTGTDLLDIEPIQNMTNLRYLSLKQAQTAPVGFDGDLAGLTGLRTLDISGLRTGDLTKIESMPRLQVLIAENACITDPTPLVDHPKVGYARLGGNCILVASAVAVLDDLKSRDIVDDDPDLSLQRSSENCSTQCTAYKICTPPAIIDCHAYDARYATGANAECKEDGFSYDVSACVELTPDEDSLLADNDSPLSDELLAEEDALLDDSDGGSGSSDADTVPRSARCLRDDSDDLYVSSGGKSYCKCDTGSHAVYYDISNDTTWRCVADAVEDVGDGLEGADVTTFSCMREGETFDSDLRPPWCTSAGKCELRPTGDDDFLRWCLTRRFADSPCGQYYLPRDCNQLAASRYQDTNFPAANPDAESSDPLERRYAQVKELGAARGEFDISGDGTLETVVALPEPLLRGHPFNSTFAGHMNRVQATIHNYIRPVDLKFHYLLSATDTFYAGDPLFNVDLFGIPTDIKKVGNYQYFDGAISGTIDTIGSMFLSPEPFFIAEPTAPPQSGALGGFFGTIPLNILSHPWLTTPIVNTEFQVYSFPTTSPDLVVPESHLDIRTQKGSIIGKLLDNIKFVDGVARKQWEPTAPIRSCEQFVYQKYYDLTRALDLAAAFEADPEYFMALLYENGLWNNSLFGEQPIAYSDLGADNILGGTTVQNRLGDYGNIACHPWFASITCEAPSDQDADRTFSGISNDRKLYREKNLFWEVTRLIDTTRANAPSSPIPHMTEGISDWKPNGPSTIFPTPEQETFMTYKTQAAAYDALTDDDDAAAQEALFKIKVAKRLKARLLQLLRYRAGIELLWNEKKEAVRKFQHELLSRYDVADIHPHALNILRTMSDNRLSVTKLEEISDPVIRALYNPATKKTLADYNDTIAAATEALRAEKWSKEESLIRGNRYAESDAARKLWSRYHYGKDIYLNGYDAPEEAYVRGDTESLLHEVLEELDGKIVKTLELANGTEDLFFDEAPVQMNCFGESDVLCGFDGERFLDMMRRLIPSETMESDYKRCMDYFKDDLEIFDSVDEGKPSLNDTPLFKVFDPYSSTWEQLFEDLYPGYDNMPVGGLYESLIALVSPPELETVSDALKNSVAFYRNFVEYDFIEPNGVGFLFDASLSTEFQSSTAWSDGLEISGTASVNGLGDTFPFSDGLTFSVTLKPTVTMDENSGTKRLASFGVIAIDFVSGALKVSINGEYDQYGADRKIPSDRFGTVAVTFVPADTKTKVTVFHDGERVGTSEIDTSWSSPSCSSVQFGSTGEGWNGLVQQITFFSQPVLDGGRIASESDVRSALSLPLLLDNIAQAQALVDEYTAFKEEGTNSVNFHYGGNICDIRNTDTGIVCIRPDGTEDATCACLTETPLTSEVSARCGAAWPADNDFTNKGARCLEAYIMLNDAWKAEQAAIARRVKEATKRLAENKETVKVTQLARIMRMEPSTPEATGDGGDTGRKDSIKRYFSEYEKFGNDYAGVEYAYIAGGGIYQIDLDWEKLNPIPELREFEPLIAQVMNELITTICRIGNNGEEDGCNLMAVEALAENPALMGQLYFEVMDGLRKMPACMLYENPASQDARKLITAIQKFVNIFKGFDPERMKKGLADALPEVDPEDFVYALAERVMREALKESPNIDYETVMRAEKVQKAVQNDVAKVRGKIKAVGNSIETIRDLITSLRNGQLPLTVGADADKVFGLMAREVLIDFIAMNVKVTFTSGITVDGKTIYATDLEKQFMMNREMIENILRNEATGGALDQALNTLTVEDTSGFNDWFSGAIGDGRASITRKVDDLLLDQKLDFQKVLEMARSVPIPEWGDDLDYAALEEEIGTGSFFNTLSSGIQPLLAQRVKEAYGLAESTPVNVSIEYTASTTGTLPSINLSLVQRALMRLLEDEVDDTNQDFINLFSALDALGDADLSSLANELETPAAIEELLGSSVDFDETDLESAFTAILNLQDVAILMQIYIDAAAEQFNFEVLNEILSGNFKYDEFIQNALVDCLTGTYPSSLAQHQIKNAALREALGCGTNCTLGNVLGNNMTAVVTGLNKVATDPTLLADQMKELSGSVMTGIEKRIREIIIGKLLLLPYGEFVLHGYGAVSFFDHTETIYEMTGFIGTRLRPEGIPPCSEEEEDCSYAKLDGVKELARDRFIGSYDDSLRPFLPYYKFYAKGMVIGLADAIIDGTLAKAQTATGLDKILGGTLSADQIRDIQASISRGEFDQELVSALWVQYGDDLVGALEKGLGTTQEELVALAKQAEEEGGLSFGEPEKNPNGAGDNKENWGERYPMGELLYDDEYTLPVTPGLSVVLQWGVSLSAEVYLKEYADYGLVEKEGEEGGRRLGLTAGLGITPTIRSDGYLSAGLGIDLAVLNINIALEGHAMFVWFAAPFRMQMLIGPEFSSDGDLTAKLYLTASLSPRLTLFDADLRLKVQVKIVGIPITYRTTIADFKPLIDRDYGNLLPIPPLSLDLFSLGQIMNAMH